MPIVLKSGSLNLLEPSGPVQACNGIALPFTFFTLEYYVLTTYKYNLFMWGQFDLDYIQNAVDFIYAATSWH